MTKYAIILCVVALFFASCASTQTDTGASSPAAASSTQIPVKIKETVLFADGSLDEYTTSQYDNAFENVQKETRYSASGAVLEWVEFEYGEDHGLLTTKFTLTSDVGSERRLQNRVVFQYNNDDYLWRETLVNRSGKAVFSYEYGYDNNGKMVKRIINESGNVKIAETVYTLDDKGRQMASETHDGSGRKINSTESRYDSNGHLINQTVFDENGMPHTVINAVWENGLEISSEQTGADGSVQLRITNEYGNSGELVKRVIENIQGNFVQIVQYEYAYKPARR